MGNKVRSGELRAVMLCQGGGAGRGSVQRLLSFGSCRSACRVPHPPAAPGCGQPYKPAFSRRSVGWGCQRPGTGQDGPAASREHGHPPLNAACVPAPPLPTMSPFSEPHQPGHGSPACRHGSRGQQAAGSRLGGHRSRGLLLQSRGHLPPWPCRPGVTARSVPGHAGCLI